MYTYIYHEFELQGKTHETTDGNETICDSRCELCQKAIEQRSVVVRSNDTDLPDCSLVAPNRLSAALLSAISIPSPPCRPFPIRTNENSRSSSFTTHKQKPWREYYHPTYPNPHTFTQSNTHTHTHTCTHLSCSAYIWLTCAKCESKHFQPLTRFCLSSGYMGWDSMLASRPMQKAYK